MLVFEKSEYLERLAKVKKSMTDEGIEVLLITDPSNMNYVSGYDAFSYYVPQAVIVAEKLDIPLCIVRRQDRYCAVETTWVGEENIIDYPDKYLWEPKTLHVMDFVADCLKEKDIANKTTGIEMDAYYFNAYWFERLKKALPDAVMKDATLLVNWIRGPKSKQELSYIQRAARIVEKSMYNAIEKIGAGVRECHVAAGICSDMLMGTGAFGGEFPALPPIMPAGERTAGAHFSWTTEGKYQKGQLVYMEIAGCYRRYHAPLSRTIFIGDPPAKIHDIAKIVIEGLHAAMDAVKPGVTCESVEKAWQSTINKYGLEKESRMGYAMGLSYPPVWTENTAYFKPGEKALLKADMTFHMMPGMWMDGCGIAITETIRVTENGCEAITQFPRQLFVR